MTDNRTLPRMLRVPGLEYFPCVPKTRRPLDHGWQTNVYTPEECAGQAGVRCGKLIQDEVGGFLVAIDIDVKHGKPGLASWSEFVAGRELPPTYSVRTGSGGVHLYYRVSAQPATRIGALTAVDVIGYGNLIVAPGSVNEHGPYEVTDASPIAWAPDWLESWVCAAPAPRAGAGRTDEQVNEDEPITLTADLVNAHIARYPNEALSQELAKLMRGEAIAGPGRRHERIRLWLIPQVLAVFGPGVTFESLCQLLTAEYPTGMSSDDQTRTYDAWVTARRKAPPTERDEREAGWQFGERAAAPARAEARRAAEVAADDPAYSADGSELNLAALLLQQGTVWYADGTWHVWVGTHWAPTEGRPFKQTNSLFIANGLQHPKFRKQRALSAVISLAENENADQRMNQDPWLLNCANGTLDLRTMTLRPHAREDCLTVCLDTRYEPGARHPVWEQALAEWSCNDPSWVRWFQWYSAQALVGECIGEFILLGSGRGSNGKSAAFSVMLKVMGDYAATLAAEAIAPKPGHSMHTSMIGRLFGKRFVLCPEVDAQNPVDMSAVKRYLGHTPFAAQPGMGKTARDISRTWTLFCDINGFPTLTGAVGRAETRRIRVLPWDMVVESGRPGWAARQMLLPGFAEAVLCWMVGGLAIDGEPPCVRREEATEALFEDSDALREWKETCCETAPEGFLSRVEAYESYRAFAMGEATPRKRFLALLRAQYPETKRFKAGRGFTGISLKPKLGRFQNKSS